MIENLINSLLLLDCLIFELLESTGWGKIHRYLQY